MLDKIKIIYDYVLIVAIVILALNLIGHQIADLSSLITTYIVKYWYIAMAIILVKLFVFNFKFRFKKD